MHAERPGSTAMELRAVSLERAGRRVLGGISASFQRHAVSAIVGPSGAGKTSLLRCLNRLEEPTNGSVLLDSSDITEIDPIQLRKRVGMIFQTPALFEGGVRGNLAYGLTDVPDDELRSALVSAGLDDEFVERDSSALSVGQAQRVCIARALVRKPEILLMDEPSSALDRDAAARIEQLVTSLNEGGLTVVLVTHNLDQALRLAHHAILVVDGRVAATGTPREVTGAWPRERSS
ncbi:MAG: ATP-binding cassette domain-containing protein [Actinobacteria bacterium]|nr:ATP-binding cassette domain-containing protein [Actinomycetota bacterium]